MTKRAFAIAAHPDDIEFFMAGTMMLLKRAGYELHYLNIANGSVGTTQYDAPTIIRMRRDEARSAAEFLGAVYHESLVNDIEIFYEQRLLVRLGSILRDVGPEILLVHSPQDYMEDHVNACRLAVTAAFCRGMRNYPVEPPRDPIAGEVTIYHAQPHGNCTPLGEVIRPNFFVDVAGVIDDKVTMLAKHASQKEWLDASQGMDSYLESMKSMSREIAGLAGGKLQYAEGWRRHNHLGFCSATADPLPAALGQFVQRAVRTGDSASPAP